MDKKEYVNRVCARLWRFRMSEYEYSQSDLDSIHSAISQCYSWGFSEADAVAFVKCTEEYNPELSEAVALERMRLICNKYPDRFKSV